MVWCAHKDDRGSTEQAAAGFAVLQPILCGRKEVQSKCSRIRHMLSSLSIYGSVVKQS